MASSQVYYMDAHSESTETSLVAKMLTVFDAAGLDKIINPNDVVAIKVHCGEWNNTALRMIPLAFIGIILKALRVGPAK